MDITKHLIGAPKSKDNITTIGEEMKYLIAQLFPQERKEYQTEFDFNPEQHLARGVQSVWDKYYHEQS